MFFVSMAFSVYTWCFTKLCILKIDILCYTIKTEIPTFWWNVFLILGIWSRFCLQTHFTEEFCNYHLLIFFCWTAYQEEIPFVKPAPINEAETKKQKKQREGMKTTVAGEEWKYVTYHSKKGSVVSEGCDWNVTTQNFNASIDVASFMIFLYKVK